MNELIRTQFYDYLNKFLIELGKSSKKIKKIIDSDYSDIKDEKYLDCIKNNIYIHKEKFLGKEDELDAFFESNSIEFLEKINLSDIWKKSQKDNKNAIVQYLKVFVFIFETANNNNETKHNENETEKNESDVDDEVEGEVDAVDGEVDGEVGESKKDKSKELDNKFEDLLKDSLLNNNQKINENMNSFYDSMKDGDNSIIDLAKDIAEELKSESGDNPNNLMNMFNNGNGINGLISSITSRLDSQIKSGNLDQNKLLSDAQKMMGNNKNLFGDLFKSMNPKNSQMPSNTSDIKVEDTTTVEHTNKKIIKKKNGKKVGNKKK
tara:strand:- start:665 stop:1627 length:963 start_codon:yes stop_codon:yes gene_type:complete